MWIELFFFFLLSTPTLARKGGAGGGLARGGGGARTGNAPQPGFGGSPGGFSGGQAGGGFKPNAAPGGFNQPHMGAPGGNFGGGRQSFGHGTGPGSASRGSNFKTALAAGALGAVGGLVAFEAGKAILHSFDRPFTHDGRNYYWDQQYYKQRPGEFMCSMPMSQLTQPTPTSSPVPESNATAASTMTTTPSPEKLLSQVQFPNGDRPKQIVWSCKQGQEVCCGTDCCPAQANAFTNSAPESRHHGPSAGQIILLILAFCSSFLSLPAAAAFLSTNVHGAHLMH